jgi:hypothetical protein
VLAVPLAIALGQQDLDRRAHQLGALVAEQLLGLRVHEQDLPGRVDDHHRIGRRFDQLARAQLAARALGDVFGDARDPHHAAVAIATGNARSWIQRCSPSPRGDPILGVEAAVLARCPRAAAMRSRSRASISSIHWRRSSPGVRP